MFVVRAEYVECMMRDIVPKQKKPRIAVKKTFPLAKPPADAARIAQTAGEQAASLHVVPPAVPSEIFWLAPEYRHYPKSKDWFWTVGFISFLLVVVALLLRNFLFAAFVALAGFAFALFSARRPHIVRFTLSAKGVLIHRTLYPFQHLKSFWIYYEPAGKKALSIESQKMFMPFITVPLGDIDPNLVRSYLKRFLKETEHQESVIEQLFEYIGF